MNQDQIQKYAYAWFHLHNVLEKQSYGNRSQISGARSRVGKTRLNSQVEANLGVKKMSSRWWWKLYNCTPLSYLKICTSKMVNFTLSKIYLNKYNTVTFFFFWWWEQLRPTLLPSLQIFLMLSSYLVKWNYIIVQLSWSTGPRLLGFRNHFITIVCIV